MNGAQHANEVGTVSQILPYHGPAPDHVPAELLTEFILYEHPGIQVDPYGTLAEVARTYPRAFYTTRNGQRKEPGSWILTRAEDLRHVLRNPKLFSSKDNSGFAQLLGESWGMIPLDIDAPRHVQMRAWLNPIVSPKPLEELPTFLEWEDELLHKPDVAELRRERSRSNPQRECLGF